MNFNKRIVVFDLEATCQKDDPNYPKEIIEIGAYDNFGHKFSKFIKPIQNPILTDFCKELTTINQEQIDSAKSFIEVYEKFFQFITSRKLGGAATIASWGAYDKYQLLKDIKLNNMTLGRIYIEDNHVNLKDYWREVKGTNAKGMNKALNQLDLKLEGIHHRGIDDAKNIMKIFNELRRLESEH